MTTDDILKLVGQLYGPGEQKKSKTEADKLLQSFQTSQEAWNVSLEILTKPNSNEAHYFAAQTLRSKVQNSFNELPKHCWQPVRDSLLDVLLGSSSESFSKSTCNQLSVAVAHLALQCEPWHNCLLYLKHMVKPDSTIRRALIIVQILQYIPEDIHSKRLELGDNRRNKLKLEFSHDVPQCTDLLRSLLTVQCAQKEDIVLRVFKCLTSWLKADLLHASSVDSNAPNASSGDQNEVSFVQLAFLLLKDDSTENEVHEVVTDFMCALVNACFSQATPEEFLSKVYDGVIELREAYIMSVAHEDSDKSQNFVTIFANTAEVFMDSIQMLTPSGVGNKVILDMLLDCCGHYDFEIALHTFNFWFCLADSICRQNDHTSADTFSPYFERLILSLFRLCQLEPDRSELLSLKDDFYEFRNLARDLIMESVQIVHPMKIITISRNILQDQTSSWEANEAAIFVVNAVAKFIHRDENQVTPVLFQRILQLSQRHDSKDSDQQVSNVCLDYTVLQFVGELGTWLTNHPQFLEAIIQFLATRLGCKELNDCASNALLNVCISNAEQLAPHFDSLCELLKYFDLQKQKSSEDLIQGLAAILSHRHVSEIKNGFEKLTKYCVESAHSASSSPQSSTTEDSKDTSQLKPYIPVLDRLSILFQHVKPDPEQMEQQPEHPCKEVIGQVLPLVLGVLHQYKMSEKVSEKGCRTLRYALRCLGMQFDSFLADLVQNVVELYAQNGFSCYLYLGGIVVDEFGMREQYHSGLSALFNQFSLKALSQFSEEKGFVNHPDTVDDFYRLVIRIAQKCPSVLFDSDKFTLVFDAAICGLHVDHKEALISVVEFVDTLFSTGKTQQPLRDRLSHILVTHGDKLFTEALSASLFSLPRYLLADVSLVFQAVSQFDHNSFCLFLANAFEVLAHREETRCKNVSEQQLRNIYSSIVQDSSYRSVTRTLKNLVKLYK